MKLKKIILEGFGLFNKRSSFEFAPDKINVILGPNESGKSTLFKAITSIIFGLKKSEWGNKYQSWVQSKNHSGEIVFFLDDREYAMKRDFDTNTVIFIKKEGKHKKSLFTGNVSAQSRTEEKQHYLNLLKEVIGLNNEDIFINTSIVSQRSLETEISGDIQQIITGAVGTNYKDILKSWMEKYFDITKKSPWKNISDKNKDRKLEQLELSIKEIESKKNQVVEASIKTSEIDEKIVKMENQKGEKERELKTLQDQFSSIKKYTDTAEKYNMLLVRHSEISQEINRIKEITQDLENKEKYGTSHFSDFRKITEDIVDNFKTYKNRNQEIDEKKTRLETLPDKKPLFIRTFILASNLFIISLLSGLAAWKFQISYLYYVAGAIGLGALALILINVFKHTRNKFEISTMKDILIKEIENLKKETGILKNTLKPFLPLLQEDKFSSLYDEYKNLSSDIKSLKYTLKNMKDPAELGKSSSKIQSELIILNKTLTEIEQDNPFLRSYKDNPREGVSYGQKLNSDIHKLEKDIDRLKSTIWDLQKRQASTFTEDQSLESLQDHLEQMEEEYKDSRFQKESLTESINTLHESIVEYQERHLERLSRNISRIYKRITNDRYTGITMTREFQPIIKFHNSREVNFSSLSCGAEEQLYFSIRLALINEINNVTRLPLLLDDPFVNFDDKRLETVKQILYSIMSDNQIFLFTHIPTYASWDNINLIKL
ncbi:MAG: AAA family ATPase [Spirochaetes bacterium]|nr:AAA family ATPase [Spirochaetota bacterium]